MADDLNFISGAIDWGDGKATEVSGWKDIRGNLHETREAALAVAARDELDELDELDVLMDGIVSGYDYSIDFDTLETNIPKLMTLFAAISAAKPR